MTTTERKVIKAKVGLLELAKQLGSVTQACRQHDPRHRDTGTQPVQQPTEHQGRDPLRRHCNSIERRNPGQRYDVGAGEVEAD